MHSRSPLASALSSLIFSLSALTLSLPSQAQTQEDSCDPAPGYREVALLGEQRDSSTGAMVAALGDINGDGVEDYAIHAGQYAYRGDAFYGLTYVVYGDPHQAPISLGLLGPDAEPGMTWGFVIAGGGGSLATGGRITALGDIDGDGIDDFALGHHFAGGPRGSFRGAVFLFHGRRAPPGTTAFPPEIDLALVDSGTYGDQIRVHYSPVPLPTNSFYGAAVGALGDLDGDGHADFVVGMSGRALVYLGQPGRPSQIEPIVALRQPPEFGTFGRSLASGFDYDGDGINDVLVCDANADPQPYSVGGICYLVWGRVLFELGPEFVVDQLRPAQGGDGSLGLVFRGGDSAAVLGSESRFIGTLDLNGDGRSDLVFGAPRVAPEGGTQPDPGRVYVVYGSDEPSFVELSLGSMALAPPGPTQLGFVLEGPRIGFGQFGNSLAVAGDVNDDGIDDLLIGAPGDRHCGTVACGSTWVLFGRRADMDGGFPPFTVVSEAALAGGLGYRIGPTTGGGQRFGGSLDSLRDFTGDGKPEWLIGARLARIGNGLRGKACLYLSSEPPPVIPPPPMLVDSGSSASRLTLVLLLLLMGLCWLNRSAPRRP